MLSADIFGCWRFGGIVSKAIYNASTLVRVSAVLALLFMFFAQTVYAQIAPGVLQSAAQTATITGTVAQSNGIPVASADVKLIGPGAHLQTQSDAHGTFAFTSVPYGTYTITAAAASLGTATHNGIVVKGDISVTIQIRSAAGGLKEIARVFTSSTGAQINTSAASIASVNPSEYAFQGNTSWKQLLNQIPGVTVGGGLSGGIALALAIPDGPFQPIILSINGALPYETATTLDGMPLYSISSGTGTQAGYGTDLSYLPMPMFDTADVVRGPGADAPSILNSIGGSFVLHTPGQVDKDQFKFSASNDPYGGVVANAKAALRFGKLSVVITYGANNSPGPLGSQNIIPANTTAPLTVNGQPFLQCTAPSSCSQALASPQYQSNGGFYEVQNSLLYCCVPNSSAWKQHDGAIALTYNITPSITAQVFYAGSSVEMPSAYAMKPVNFTPASSYGGSVAPGWHNYIGVATPGEDDTQAASLLEEKITAYVGRGIVRIAALQQNSFENQSNPYGLPDGQYAVYGTGYYGTTSPGTPVTFNGTTEHLTFTPFSYQGNYWENNRDLLISYATQIGRQSNLSISYLTSFYNDPYGYNYTFGAPLNCIVTGSLSPAVSATTKELRLHAGTEISTKLSLDASWYLVRSTYHVQNPSDLTGNTYADSVFSYNAPRLGLVWRANRDIAVRVAVGTGYALPPLYYLIGTNGAPSCTTGIYCTVSLENLNLQPEKSFGFNVGTDIRLRRDTVFSLDLYRVNLYGQFFNSANQTGTFQGLPLFTSQEGNLSQSRYEGLSIDIHHDVQRGMYWRGALGLTRGYVVSVPAGFYNTAGHVCNFASGTSCTNLYIVPGINFDGKFQSTVPYANGAAQIGYRWSPGKYIDLSPTYYGNNNQYYERAFVELDAHAGYTLTKNVSLLATFRNITGVYDQNYQLLSPVLGAPTVAGRPYPLFGVPYGPRTMIVTLNYGL